MVNSPLIKVVIFDIETYTSPLSLSYAASTVIEDLLRFYQTASVLSAASSLGGSS